MSGARNLKAWAALLMAALAASVLMAMVLAGPAQAATLTVTTAADEQNTDGQCSLREAIENANRNNQSGSADCPAGVGEDTINFQLSLSPATITLVSQQLTIADSAGLTIDGGSANITVSGNNAVRVFEVRSGAKLTLNNLTVANGRGAAGGGIANQGTLTVTNSTLSGNRVTDVDYGKGGSISSSGGSVTLKNTIVANSPSGGDCYATITDGGHNLDSDGGCGFGTANHSLSGFDPMLGPLADNGGPTLTHALLAGSPAIDKGSSFSATIDQRGLPRPSNFVGIVNAADGSDIGAFESQAPPDTTAPRVSAATPTGTGIGRGTNVKATSSEAMDAATIDGTTLRLTKAGSTKTVGAALAYDAASQKAVLDPNNNLAAGTRYKAVVTTGAEDPAGNALDQKPTKAGEQQKAWTFTTKG